MTLRAARGIISQVTDANVRVSPIERVWPAFHSTAVASSSTKRHEAEMFLKRQNLTNISRDLRSAFGFMHMKIGANKVYIDTSIPGVLELNMANRCLGTFTPKEYVASRKMNHG